MRFIVSSKHQVLYDCQFKIGQHIPRYLSFHNFSGYVFMLYFFFFFYKRLQEPFISFHHLIVVYEIPQWWSDFYIALTPNYFVVAIISQMLEVE